MDWVTLTSVGIISDFADAQATTIDHPLTGNPVEDTKLANAKLYRRSQALEHLAEDDREAIIKAIDAMVTKHQTRRTVEEIGS